MKLNHIALYTKNLDAMKSFYEKYFLAESGPLYHNEKTGLMTYFLSFPHGGRLEIMTRPMLYPMSPELEKMGYVHMALSVGEKDIVDAITGTLKNDNFFIVSEPRMTGDGYYESCILDPDGNQIEITV